MPKITVTESHLIDLSSYWTWPFDGSVTGYRSVPDVNEKFEIKFSWRGQRANAKLPKTPKKATGVLLCAI